MVGFLSAEMKQIRGGLCGVCRDGLRALGYEEGRNIRVEQRYGGADADVQRVTALARELVGMNVTVLVVDGDSPRLRSSAKRRIPSQSCAFCCLIQCDLGLPISTDLAAK